MHRGTLISERPVAVRNIPLSRAGAAAAEPALADRVLSTEEANAFLGRQKGFLEKRRSSGIDSPRYIQRCKGAAVTYRVSDLLRWEDAHMCTASSDHDDPVRRDR